MEYKQHSELLSRYDEIHSVFQTNLLFDRDLIKNSRNIFKIDELKNIAKPKDLEVVALLGGLPFSQNFQESVLLVQNKIRQILNQKLNYMVKKENLGVELLVLKWPKNKRNFILEKKVIEYIDKLNLQEFFLFFDGIQIHNDGCIIVRGFDSNNQFTKLRKKIFEKFPEIPIKQSNLVHVPIGRILTEINKEDSYKLIDLVQTTRAKNEFFPIEKINSIKIIHEEKWYMEKRSTIKTWNFKK